MNTPATSIGWIDHIVIAVADLDRDAQTYRRLGFTLSPKGVHSAALGSANHTIMLQNDYFELLTVTNPTDRNARWRQALAGGGGVAGLAMTTQDATAAHAHWQAQGLSPDELIRFSRDVVRADGVRMEARFEVVSLPDLADIALRLFVCSQPTREAVWLPELMEHANTAVGVAALTLACADPVAAAAQWRRVNPTIAVAESADGVALSTGPHRIELARSQTTHGIRFKVRDLAACRTLLTRNGVPHEEVAGALAVAPAEACNVALSFVEG